jgi:hypothetical protein
LILPGAAVFFKFPKALKPILDFVVHVVVGSVAFLVLIGASALVSVCSNALNGLVPHWFEAWSEYGEMALFGIDMLCFALFIASETVKLLRRLWNE